MSRNTSVKEKRGPSATSYLQARVQALPYLPQAKPVNSEESMRRKGEGRPEVEAPEEHTHTCLANVPYTSFRSASEALSFIDIRQMPAGITSWNERRNLHRVERRVKSRFGTRPRKQKRTKNEQSKVRRCVLVAGALLIVERL